MDTALAPNLDVLATAVIDRTRRIAVRPPLALPFGDNFGRPETGEYRNQRT